MMISLIPYLKRLRQRHLFGLQKLLQLSGLHLGLLVLLQEDLLLRHPLLGLDRQPRDDLVGRVKVGLQPDGDLARLLEPLLEAGDVVVPRLELLLDAVHRLRNQPNFLIVPVEKNI